MFLVNKGPHGEDPGRLLLSIALVVLIASVQNVCADHHWWKLARGTDVKIYDKCVNSNMPPHETYDNAVRIGLPAKLEDKESEVDVTIDLKTASLSFRWSSPG